MNNSKKINVNFSSLMGLKAELLRKQMEVQDAKAKIDPSTQQLSKVKLKSKKKKNSSKEIKSKSSEVTEIEDINMLKKSNYMLQAKSKLYEKLKKNHGNGDNHYLVDFENKSDESGDEFYKEEDYEDTNSDPEEDWVEYQDCFGRTRKCLRRDLPRMMDKDNLIKREITKDPPEKNDNQPIEKPTFIEPEKEPEIVMMRKKWEEQTEKLAHKTDIHYQDILFDEARSHGVGYFAFSQDESERAKQQAELSKLRKETEERQKELQKVKDLKEKMEQNRLKAARIRRRIRAGLSAESDDEENSQKNSEQPIEKSSKDVNANSLLPETNNECSEKAEEGEQSLAVIEDKIKAFGELLGKRPKWRVLSQAEWIEKRRKDRHGEFAPVYDHFKSAGFLKQVEENKDYKLIVKESESDDPLKVPGGGPEPTDLWESSGIISYEQNNSVTSDKDQPNQVANADQNIKVNLALPTSNNLQETFVPICPVPPPLFDTSIPPPSVISAIPPLSEISSTQPFLNSNYVSLRTDLYPVPPHSNASIRKPSSNKSPSINLNTLNSVSLSKNEQYEEKSCDESDEDDSEIIGPMPPTSTINNSEDLSQIPLPNDTDTRKNIHKTIVNENKLANLDDDSIVAGLKYLRQQFDNNHNS